jgi:hypothetical protein
MCELNEASFSRRWSFSSELRRKARLLRDVPLFEDKDGAYHQKRVLFLVLAGAKPVGHAVSGHMVRTGDFGHSVADHPQLVSEFLKSLGLECSVSKSAIVGATDAVVSLDRDVLARYGQAADGDHATVGRLLGYPETAVAAFAAGAQHLLSIEEQRKRETDAGVDPSIVMFRLSKQHWPSELAVAARWQRLLEAAGLMGADRREAR